MAGDWSSRDEVAHCAARAAEAGRRLAIPSGSPFVVYRFYASPETQDRMTLVNFNLDGAKHSRLIEDLNRWLIRKGLGDFDVKSKDDYLRHPEAFFTYGDFESVSSQCPLPVTVELLGGTADRNDFYAIAPRPERVSGMP
jgi:hypothetical protein